jgi:hypothetical protein
MFGRSPGWGLAGLLFLLVLGIIGMHGVGPHGVGAGGHVVPALVTASTAVVAEHGDHPVTAGAFAVADSDGPLKAVPGNGEHGPGLLELCMAVLLGFAVLLLIALAVGGRPAHIPPIRIGMRSRAHRPVPPSLTGLSLLRC